MVRIGLLSDTHDYLDDKIRGYVAGCDEIWHAGDIGQIALLDTLASWKPLRAVWGNIDDRQIRNRVPERLLFTIDNLRVAMVHIGGYPGKYAPGIKQWLKEEKAGLMVCGHSHIVKAVPDPAMNLLHLNPGAAGRQGWHQVRTMMRFGIDNGVVTNLELIELGSKRVADKA